MLETWRQKFQRLGMRQVSVWVPRAIADRLQQLFTRIGMLTEDGHFLRVALERQSLRRRAVEKVYEGQWFKLEIDLPRLRVGSEAAPIGGRIYGDRKTLIELDPFEAAELEKTCANALEPLLCAWLEKRGLKDCVRNTTGVALDANYLTDSSDILQMTDEEFEKNERAIVLDYERRVFYQGAIAPEDPTLQHFIGFWGIPSRYRLVHGTFGGRLCVGLIHVEGGGTSVTNAIERIAQDVHQKHYRTTAPDKIEWYDVWPAHYNFADGVRINRVRFNKPFSNPEWCVEEAVPVAFAKAAEKAIEDGLRAETAAFYKSNPNAKWLFRDLDRKRRLSYGNFQADIWIKDAPEVKAVAVLGSWPRQTELYGKPYLFISLPGAYEFRHKETCDALLHHWGNDAKILARESSVIESWDDPDLLRFCKRAGLPLDAAKQHYCAPASAD